MITITSKEQEYIIVEFTDSEMGFRNVSKIKNFFDKNIYELKQNIIFDIKNVNYIDSSGIGTLFEILNKLKANSNKFCLINLKSEIKNIISLTHIEDFFKYFDTVNEASAYLKN